MQNVRFNSQLFAAPCYLAFGRHLKVPIVGTVTSVFHDWLSEVSGNPMNLAYIPSMFSIYDQHMSFKERLINVLLSNYISGQMHYYTNSQLEFVKKYFGIDVPHIKDLYYDLSLYLVNTHYSLHGIRPMTTNVIEVGGLHLKDDDQPSPVCLNEDCFFRNSILFSYNACQFFLHIMRSVTDFLLFFIINIILPVLSLFIQSRNKKNNYK